jgi:hypothetical protein
LWGLKLSRRENFEPELAMALKVKIVEANQLEMEGLGWLSLAEMERGKLEVPLLEQMGRGVVVGFQGEGKGV